MRLQLSDHKKHLELILLIRCCIIVHNLIIRIEDEIGFDEEWRNSLIDSGLEVPVPANMQPRNPAADGSNEEEMDVDQPDVHPGMVFREELMQKLFDSPLSSAQRCPS